MIKTLTTLFISFCIITNLCTQAIEETSDTEVNANWQAFNAQVASMEKCNSSEQLSGFLNDEKNLLTHPVYLAIYDNYIKKQKNSIFSLYTFNLLIEEKYCQLSKFIGQMEIKYVSPDDEGYLEAVENLKALECSAILLGHMEYKIQTKDPKGLLNKHLNELNSQYFKKATPLHQKLENEKCAFDYVMNWGFSPFLTNKLKESIEEAKDLYKKLSKEERDFYRSLYDIMDVAVTTHLNDLARKKLFVSAKEQYFWAKKYGVSINYLAEINKDLNISLEVKKIQEQDKLTGKKTIILYNRDRHTAHADFISTQGKIETVPPDGSCAVHAVLRAIKDKEIFQENTVESKEIQGFTDDIGSARKYFAKWLEKIWQKKLFNINDYDFLRYIPFYIFRDDIMDPNAIKIQENKNISDIVGKYQEKYKKNPNLKELSDKIYSIGENTILHIFPLIMYKELYYYLEEKFLKN